MLPDPATPTSLRPSQTRFDWDEARRLHAEGLTYKEVGERLGVSHAAVKRVCNLENLRSSREYQRRPERLSRTRELQTVMCACGRAKRWRIAECCRLCHLERPAKTVRPDALHCHRCGIWKLDKEFPRHRSKPARRHRDHECRACQAARKRDERARQAKQLASKG